MRYLQKVLQYRWISHNLSERRAVVVFYYQTPKYRVSVPRPVNRTKKSVVPGSPSDGFLLLQKWCFSPSSPSAPFFPVTPLHRRVPCLALRRGYLAFEIPPRHFRELSSVFMIGLSVLDVFKGCKITVRTLIFLSFWNTLDTRNTFSGILTLQA